MLGRIHAIEKVSSRSCWKKIRIFKKQVDKKLSLFTCRQVGGVWRQNKHGPITQRPLHLQQPTTSALMRPLEPLHALVEEGQMLIHVGDKAALLDKLGEELGGEEEAVKGMVGLVAGPEEGGLVEQVAHIGGADGGGPPDGQQELAVAGQQAGHELKKGLLHTTANINFPSFVWNRMTCSLNASWNPKTKIWGGSYITVIEKSFPFLFKHQNVFFFLQLIESL